MATSGTFTFGLDVITIVEEAFERCGLEAKNGYDFQTARRSMNIMFLEWQNKGLNLWTVKNDSVTLTPGTAAYPLSSERLDVIEASIRTGAGTSGQQDIRMRPISISNFAQRSNKLLPGKPLQYWIEKGTDEITLNLWPVPDSSQTYVMDYYYIQRVEDAGAAINTAAVPSRFLPPLISGLAYYLSVKKAPEKAPDLKAMYDSDWNDASDADRNKASFFVKPARSI